MNNIVMDIKNREKVAKEIAKTSESIRKKHRALKTGKIDEDIAVKTHFGPIIKPLQKIADTPIVVKNEPMEIVPKQEDDTIPYMSSIPLPATVQQASTRETSLKRNRSPTASSTPYKTKRMSAPPDVSPVISVMNVTSASPATTTV